MKNKIEKLLAVDQRLNCFGEFRPEDLICRKLCVVSLRCIVERDQNSRMELLEELLTEEGTGSRVQ